MPIINSILVSSVIQVDGSYSVHEQHTDSDGNLYDHSGFVPGSLDPTAVMNERAVRLGAEIDARNYVLAEATNFEVPLTQVEIMRRLTPTEWAAFQSSTDINIAYFRDVFAKTKTVYRNDPLTQAGLGALVAYGILTTERVAEVMA